MTSTEQFNGVIAAQGSAASIIQGWYRRCQRQQRRVRSDLSTNPLHGSAAIDCAGWSCRSCSTTWKAWMVVRLDLSTSFNESRSEG